jgi:hypothetical protein
MSFISSKRLLIYKFISIAILACASRPAYAIAIHDHPCKKNWAEPVPVDSRFFPLPKIMGLTVMDPVLLDLEISLDVKAPPACEPFSYVHSQLQAIKFTIHYDNIVAGKTNLVGISFLLRGDRYSVEGLNNGIAKSIEFDDYIFGAPRVFNFRGLLKLEGDPAPLGGGAVNIRNITASATGEHHYDVPAPLPILGAGMAFSAARRLRKKSRRLKLSNKLL